MTSGRKNPRRPRNGDEQDVFTGWRRVYVWTQRAGATAGVKRRARRRERHEAKAALRDIDLTDAITIHEKEQHLFGAVDEWRPPSGTHDYRGMGRSGARPGEMVWTPCNVCGKDHAHKDHGPWYRWCSYGTGTTLAVADLHDRNAIGIDLDPRNRDLLPARIEECRRALFGARPELPGQVSLFDHTPTTDPTEAA